MWEGMGWGSGMGGHASLMVMGPPAPRLPARLPPRVASRSRKAGQNPQLVLRLGELFGDPAHTEKGGGASSLWSK